LSLSILPRSGIFHFLKNARPNSVGNEYSCCTNIDFMQLRAGYLLEVQNRILN
jgi:hypothetical protein